MPRMSGRAAIGGALVSRRSRTTGPTDCIVSCAHPFSSLVLNIFFEIGRLFFTLDIELKCNVRWDVEICDLATSDVGDVRCRQFEGLQTADLKIMWKRGMKRGLRDTRSGGPVVRSCAARLAQRLKLLCLPRAHLQVFSRQRATNEGTFAEKNLQR